MRYLTYSGNNLIDVELPDDATVLYPPEAIPGIPKRSIPQALRAAVENPLGMPPLKELVGRDSRVLIAFDDNCQPFPPMQRPDIRHVPMTEARKKLGTKADALALDQKVRSPKARALGWAPTRTGVINSVPRLVEEFRNAQRER